MFFETDPDQYALDEFLSQEQEMEEALLENIIPDFNHHPHLHQHPDNNPSPHPVMSSPSRSDRSSFYGDDDIDYDDIFKNITQDHQIYQHHDMDMTG